MARPRVRPLINVNCEYCENPLERYEDKRRNKFDRYYCNQTCYWAWMGEQGQPTQIHNRHDEEDLINELQRVTNLLGYAPSYEEMKEFSTIFPKAYQTHFGTWEQVKRLVGWLPDYETFQAEQVSPEDGSWLAGLIDGEGCFRLQKPSPKSGCSRSKSYAPTFCMSLRDDDTHTLNELRRIIGSKTEFHIDERESEHRKGRENAKPAIKFFVRDLPTLAYHLVPILEKYPLRSKKKNDLKLFKMAIDTLLGKWLAGRKNLSYTEEERDLLDRLFLALKEIKLYKSSFADVIAKYNLPTG